MNKYVFEVAKDKGISYENVKNIFKSYGFTDKESDDFWNSKWVDVDDALKAIPELNDLFNK